MRDEWRSRVVEIHELVEDYDLGPWVRIIPDADLRAEIAAAVDAVYRRWMEAIGDVHDAWDPDELVGAVLGVLRTPRRNSG